MGNNIFSAVCAFVDPFQNVYENVEYSFVLPRTLFRFRQPSPFRGFASKGVAFFAFLFDEQKASSTRGSCIAAEGSRIGHGDATLFRQVMVNLQETDAICKSRIVSFVCSIIISHLCTNLNIQQANLNVQSWHKMHNTKNKKVAPQRKKVREHQYKGRTDKRASS